MSKCSHFNNGFNSLFFDFSMPLTCKKPNIYFQIYQNSAHLLFRDSKDPLVSSVSPKLKSGLWEVTSDTQITEAELNFRKIRGPLHEGRSGLGNVNPTSFSEEGSQAHCKLVTKFHLEIEEKYNLERYQQLQLQCHWVQREGYIQNNFTWKTILAMLPNLLPLYLGATYNVLSSPSNLKRWHLASESRRLLCHKDVCTIPHILGACNISLQQGTYFLGMKV